MDGSNKHRTFTQEIAVRVLCETKNQQCLNCVVFGCICSPQKLMVRTGVSPARKIGPWHMHCMQFDSVQIYETDSL